MHDPTDLPDSLRNLQHLHRDEALASEWMTIEQDETDTFAKLTDDVDPMHNDPEWARQTLWGGTIVQAAHVLALGAGQVSLLPLDTKSDGSHYVLNYGYDRVRVISPLRVGHPFRYLMKVGDIRRKSENTFVVKLDVSVEIRGSSVPYMVYESLVYWATDQEMARPESVRD